MNVYNKRGGEREGGKIIIDVEVHPKHSIYIDIVGKSVQRVQY